MPSGVGGGRFPASQGGVEATLADGAAAPLALGSGDAPLLAFGWHPAAAARTPADNAAMDARHVTRRSRVRSAVALSKAELLHLELQSLA